MEVKKKSRNLKRVSGGGESKKRIRYSFELKLKVVKLYLEEEYSANFIIEQFGISKNSLWLWRDKYLEKGEEGLKPLPPAKVKEKLPSIVKDKIIELKQNDSLLGCRRISDFLRRIFFLKASPETVRKTLHKEGLIEKTKRKYRRNPSKPRFFERSTPNQMWQTDILTFRLGGQNAYVIGYMDDYSRFITGLGLFRSQTAENVIEVYRKAIGEYGKPKEVLTDNGRQYTNWRGTTRFERELKKDNIFHIKSRPHHPMTLGKIERFWKTIFSEFLSRAQFENFESARERISLWVKYYNHKRPHQGIQGLCPADRYFEIQNDLRRVMESGIQENVLEIALRGKPRKSFYMVGRLGDQAVTLRTEKGKFKVLTEDPEKEEKVKEMIYDLSEGEDNNGDEKEQDQEDGSIQCSGEMRSCVVDLGGEEETRRYMSGDGDTMVDIEQLAEPGTGSDSSGTGTEEEDGQRSETKPSSGETASESSPYTEPGEDKTFSGEKAPVAAGI